GILCIFLAQHGELLLAEDGTPFGFGLGDLEGLGLSRLAAAEAQERGGSSDRRQRGRTPIDEITAVHGVVSLCSKTIPEAASTRNHFRLTKTADHRGREVTDSAGNGRD